MTITLSILAFVISLTAVGYAFLLFTDIMQKPDGDAVMRRAAAGVQHGAKAFLGTEIQVLAGVLALVAFVLIWNDQKQTALAFLTGGALSALAGFFGVHTATRSAVRTTEAAKTGLGPALRVAFQSGTVMGLAVVGLGLAGVCVVYWFYSDTPHVVIGVSLGASSVALVARIGGGMFTNAASIGAAYAGKLEASVPAGDPRNPAIVARHVGSYVGGVAGIGADLFESYVAAVIATMVLGVHLVQGAGAAAGSHAYVVVLPLVLCALGTIGSIFGRRFVYTEDETKVRAALQRGTWAASVAFAVGAAIACVFLPEELLRNAGVAAGFADGWTKWGVYAAVVTGLVLGVVIAAITEHCTSANRKPAAALAHHSSVGAAANVLHGFAGGMKSTWAPLLLIALAVLLAYDLAGIYGVSVASVGMLSTLGITLGVDAFGPVASNSARIAAITNQDPSVRKRTDALDAAAQTTGAVGRGVAIGSAALTVLALFQVFLVASKLDLARCSLARADVVAGLLIGGMLPFAFASLSMIGARRAAHELIDEARRQFRSIPGLVEGTAEPESAKCVAIATRGALRELIVPGLLAVAVPLVIGKWLGLPALAGVLAGATVTGVLLAICLTNAGGAWASARRVAQRLDPAEHAETASEAQTAAMVGETVGESFERTAGPTVNILIKLMSVVSIIAAPLLA